MLMSTFKLENVPVTTGDLIRTGPSAPNQSFCYCIYGGQLWSDFCAGHFVAGFSLGGWQGRSDSPTGAQDRQRAAAAKWAGSRPNKPNGQETQQQQAGPIILSSSELRC